MIPLKLITTVILYSEIQVQIFLDIQIIIKILMIHYIQQSNINLYI